MISMIQYIRKNWHLCAAASWLLAVPAQAESLTYTEQKQRFDGLYTQMIADPGNENITLSYAESAVKMGDYEAAIPPMERLLMANPSTPKIKLEIGILYFLLGSNDVARTYLMQARAQAKDQPNIAAQADDYLSRM